jgi:hypothetical protein
MWSGYCLKTGPNQSELGLVYNQLKWVQTSFHTYFTKLSLYIYYSSIHVHYQYLLYKWGRARTGGPAALRRVVSFRQPTAARL